MTKLGEEPAEAVRRANQSSKIHDTAARRRRSAGPHCLPLGSALAFSVQSRNAREMVQVKCSLFGRRALPRMGKLGQEGRVAILKTDPMACTGVNRSEPQEIAATGRRSWGRRAYGERDAAFGVALSLCLHALVAAASAPTTHPARQEEPYAIDVEILLTPAAEMGEPTKMADASILSERSDRAITSLEPQSETRHPTAEPASGPQAPTPESPSLEPVVENTSEAAPLTPPVPVMRPKISREPSRPTPKLAATVPLAPPTEVAPSSATPTGAPELAVQQASVAPPVTRAMDAALANEALGRYAARLRGLIDAHKAYPPQALMRREEGTVRLRIVVDRDGKLVEVTVLSAASPHLVDASVEATKAAAPFPSLPAELSTQRATFELPITFRLE